MAFLLILISTPEEVEAVGAVHAGSMSGRDFLLRYFNGKLYSDCFTAQVAELRRASTTTTSLKISSSCCVRGCPSGYYVEDTRENYEVMATALDKRWTRYIRGALRRRDELVQPN